MKNLLFITLILVGLSSCGSNCGDRIFSAAELDILRETMSNSSKEIVQNLEETGLNLLSDNEPFLENELQDLSTIYNKGIAFQTFSTSGDNCATNHLTMLYPNMRDGNFISMVTLFDSKSVLKKQVKQIVKMQDAKVRILPSFRFMGFGEEMIREFTFLNLNLFEFQDLKIEPHVYDVPNGAILTFEITGTSLLRDGPHQLYGIAMKIKRNQSYAGTSYKQNIDNTQIKKFNEQELLQQLAGVKSEKDILAILNPKYFYLWSSSKPITKDILLTYQSYGNAIDEKSRKPLNAIFDITFRKNGKTEVELEHLVY